MSKNKQVANDLTLRIKEIQDAGEATCCGIIEALHEIYPLPFDRPIVFGAKDGSLTAPGWAIRMGSRTPSGNVSQKTEPVMFISHCPFCGEPFEDEKAKTKSKVIAKVK